MVKQSHIITLLLVALVGLVGYQVVTDSVATINLENANAQAGANSSDFAVVALNQASGSGQLLAVVNKAMVRRPGNESGEESVLSLAVYDTSRENRLKVWGIRQIEWDFHVRAWKCDTEDVGNGRRRNGMHPLELRAHIDEGDDPDPDGD